MSVSWVATVRSMVCALQRRSAIQCVRARFYLCCVELCSLHHQYAADPQQVVANALFSDGAAAIVGNSDESPDCSWRLVDQFSYVLPETGDLMTWRIGDNGFDMRLSPHVPGVIKQMLKPWLCAQLCASFTWC